MSNQKGVAHLLAILGVLVLGGTLLSTNLSVSRSYPDSNVKGVTASKEMMKREDIKVSTMEGKTVVVEKTSGAVSTFPLTLNEDTNALVVTTPAGEKTVTVLPDVAVNNLLASRVITEVDSSDTTGSLGSLSRVVDLEEKNGVLVYKVSGQRKNLILGLPPVKTQVTAYVSAESGEVIESSQSFLGRLLNKISSTAD